MNKLLLLLLTVLTFTTTQKAIASASVMNPGEAIGQLIFLSAEDVKSETEKYKGLNPLSIPVFAELPLDMSVVAGAITLKQQTLLSHVQLKSRARHTPNLDASGLEGGLSNTLLSRFKDGDWVKMVLTVEGQVSIEASTEAAANDFYNKRKADKIELKADVDSKDIYRSEDLHSSDAIRVGSKAANYGELTHAVNTAERTVVHPGYAIPFYYYQEFIDMNPKIKTAIQSILRDPLMAKVAKVSYRESKLKKLQDMMTSDEAVVNETLVAELVVRFNQLKDRNGVPRKLKLRSSTNSEDLPNFNGAGLYDSFGYNPVSKDGKEKSEDKKKETLVKILKSTWASVWNLRAYDERAFFHIPHEQVRMAIQVNPAFPNELYSGVVVSKNSAGRKDLLGKGVYIEVQRGSEYSVTNPVANIKPQKILVIYDEKDILNSSKYVVHVLQNSNIADDNKTILDHDNVKPVMTTDEILDLCTQVLKSHLHFQPIYGQDNPDFALDLEFKLDTDGSEKAQIYLKQARPYLE